MSVEEYIKEHEEYFKELLETFTNEAFLVRMYEELNNRN
jgi:hypothetical protein